MSQTQDREKNELEVPLVEDSVESEPDCDSGLYATLMSVFFIDLIGLFLVLPLIPLVSKDLHATNAQIGYCVGMVSFAIAFSQVFWGAMSDYFPRRTIVVINLVVQGVAYVMGGCSTSIWMMIASRALSGLGCGIGPVLAAILFENSPLKFRARDLMNIYSTMYLAIAIGPCIAGGINLFVDWRGVFFAAAFGPIINIAFVYWSFPVTDNRNLAAVDEVTGLAKEDPFQLWLRWLKQERSVLVVLTGHGMMWIAGSMVNAVMVLVNTEVFGFSLRDNLMCFAVGGTAQIILCKSVNVLEVVGARRSIMVRLVLHLTTIIFVMKCRSHWAPYVFAACFFVSGVFSSAASGVLLQTCPPAANGINNGIFQFVQMMGEAIGPFIAGHLLERGVWWPYMVSLGLTVVNFVFIPCAIPEALQKTNSEKSL